VYTYMRSEEESIEATSRVGEERPPTRSRRAAAKKTKAEKPKARRKAGEPEEAERAKAKVEATPQVDVRELLKLRESIRKSRPKFLRQESWRYVRLKEGWRKPKGIDSKMRKMVKGWPRLVKIGYRTPAAARGLHPSGFRDVLVSTVGELEKLNPETDAVRLSATLGARRRLELIKRAEELGLKVLNPRGIRLLKTKE